MSQEPPDAPATDTHYLDGSTGPAPVAQSPRHADQPEAVPAHPYPNQAFPVYPSGIQPRPIEQPNNTSGMMSDDIPPEIARMKWNWGAALLSTYWANDHGMNQLGTIQAVLVIAWIIASLAPLNPLFMAVKSLCFLAVIGYSIWFGLIGNREGWRYRRFPEGVPEFIDHQRSWMIRSFIAFPLAVGLLVGALVFAYRSMEQNLPGGQSAPYASSPQPPATPPPPAASVPPAQTYFPAPPPIAPRAVPTETPPPTYAQGPAPAIQAPAGQPGQYPNSSGQTIQDQTNSPNTANNTANPQTTTDQTSPQPGAPVQPGQEPSGPASGTPPDQGSQPDQSQTGDSSAPSSSEPPQQNDGQPPNPTYPTQ